MSLRDINVMVNDRIRMLIASKNVMFLEGIGVILRQDPSIEIVGEARTLEDTIEAADRLLPHIVLLDAVLTDGRTLEAIQHIRKRHKKMGILVLNVSGRLKATARLQKAGASVYVSPETQVGQLKDLIHSTYQRGIHARYRQTFRKSTPDVKTSKVLPANVRTDILRTREGRNG